MVICVRCHRYKALNEFYYSSDDPLALVCEECKKGGFKEREVHSTQEDREGDTVRGKDE